MPTDLPDAQESPARARNGDGTEIGRMSAALATQLNFRSAGPTPGIPHKLCLLPWAEWEEGKDYCATTPVQYKFLTPWNGRPR